MEKNKEYKILKYKNKCLKLLQQLGGFFDSLPHAIQEIILDQIPVEQLWLLRLAYKGDGHINDTIIESIVSTKL